MNNWDQSLYLSTVALNSENKAMDKQGIYMDSLEAKTKSLAAAWDRFTTKGTDASFFKILADGAKGLLSVLDKMGVTIKTLIPLLGGVLLNNLTTPGKSKLVSKIGNALNNSFRYPIASIFGKDIKRGKEMSDFLRGSAVTDLGISGLDKRLKNMAASVAELGKATQDSSSLLGKMTTKMVDGFATIDKTEGAHLTKSMSRRLKFYQKNNLTVEEAEIVEKALADAREKTAENTIQAEMAEAIKNGDKGTQKQLQGKALRQGLGKVASAVGTGIMVGTITKSVIEGVGNFIKDKWFPESISVLENKVSEIVKSIENKGFGATKENLDLLDKVITQSSTTGEFTEDMQEQLKSILDVLDENLGVNRSLLKTDEKGNITLQSLKDLQEEYYNVAADSEELLSTDTKSALKELREVASTTGYSAYGKGMDGLKFAADMAGWVAGGATAGAILGGSAGFGIGAAPGALIGGLLGGGIVSLMAGLGKYDTAVEQGKYKTIEEAIEKTKENIKGEKNNSVKNELNQYLERLEATKEKIDEVIDAARKEAASELSIKGRQEAKRLREAAIAADGSTTAVLTGADKSMIDNIIDIVTSSMTAEQLVDSEYQKRLIELENKMIEARFGAAEDTNASYTQFAQMFEQGGDFYDLLKGIDVSTSKIEAIVSANLPTLAKAAADLKDSISKIKDEYERASKAASAQNTLLNNLADMGFSLNMSAEDVNKMLNLGGEVDTAGILDPAYRKYARDLSDLYKEYWGENGKIANATYLQDQELLIQEYERAVSLRQKEYEILQKQLEVQEAQNKLMQAQRERDTLVFRNGHFMYEANPATIQGLTEEQEKKQREMEQLQVQSQIEEHTNNILDRVNDIANAMGKLEEILGDIATGMAPQELVEMIRADLADNGIIDNESLKIFFKQLETRSLDYQQHLWEWLGYSPEEIKGHYDSGGLLKGQGIFRKDSYGDEVVLSPTDAPQVLALLSKTGEFAETVYDANNLLRALTMRDTQIGSLLNGNSGGNNYYNVEHITVEEADDIESILNSAQRQIGMLSPKFIRK